MRMPEGPVLTGPVLSGLVIRDEPCYNRGGTVDNLGPKMNRFEPVPVTVVLKCLKQSGVTGSKPGRRRERPCFHLDKPSTMKMPGMPPGFRLVEPR